MNWTPPMFLICKRALVTGAAARPAAHSSSESPKDTTGSDGEKRILHHVHPGHGQHGVATVRAFQNGKFRALRGLDNFVRLHFAPIDARENDPRGRALRDGISKFVTAIQDDGPAGRNRRGEVAFFVRNRFTRAHEFEMRDADVGDDGDIGLRQVREWRDLAGMIHADLPDPDLVACRRLEHRLRQSDVIVEIALRFCDAKAVRQNRRGEILRARFPVAAGDGDDFDA